MLHEAFINIYILLDGVDFIFIVIYFPFSPCHDRTGTYSCYTVSRGQSELNLPSHRPSFASCGMVQRWSAGQHHRWQVASCRHRNRRGHCIGFPVHRQSTERWQWNLHLSSEQRVYECNGCTGFISRRYRLLIISFFNYKKRTVIFMSL